MSRTQPVASPAPGRPRGGFWEATAAPERRVAYAACITWPRSGHHLLVDLLRLSLGDRFGYCEHYVPSRREGSMCCRSFPCAKRAVVTLSKNHDVDLSSPVPTDVPIIVQHRSFLPSVVSNFELYVANGNPDTPASFAHFAERSLSQYKRFRAKWVLADLSRRLTVDYDDLAAAPEITLTRVLGFLGAHDVPVDAIRWAVGVAPGATVPAEAGRGVVATRLVGAFQHFDAERFARLAAIAEDDAIPPAPAPRMREVAAGAAVPAFARLPAPGAVPFSEPDPDATAAVVAALPVPLPVRHHPPSQLPLFVYVHIQKTGGTSMRAAVEQLFGPAKIFWHGKDGMVNELHAAGSLSRLADFGLIGGHFPASLVTAERVGRPVMLLGLVRNPVHQIISHYEYVRTRPDNRLHTEASLLKAVAGDTEFATFSRGLQSRMLTGRTNGDVAFDALGNSPHLVGTIDKAQAVADRLAELIGVTPVRLGRINAQVRGYRAEYEDPATMEALRPLAHQDFRFFRRIVRLGGISERLPEDA